MYSTHVVCVRINKNAYPSRIPVKVVPSEVVLNNNNPIIPNKMLKGVVRTIVQSLFVFDIPYLFQSRLCDNCNVSSRGLGVVAWPRPECCSLARGDTLSRETQVYRMYVGL